MDARSIPDAIGKGALWRSQMIKNILDNRRLNDPQFEGK